ncbi:DNA repair protein RAD16 [Paramarasmius palmivorus]|uniref:DNA repair protein RAD16 n=1 Tax=Paramarasmius palmivorus TaxID=297713 RepID=A0AAW0CLS1_9AGAR
MSTILPFHETILSEIHDPATSDLLVLARGLGLRRIICTLLKIYDSPQNLVLLVNATPEEETEIGEELGIMGCRKPGLRIVGYEAGSSRDRQDLYKKGGLISVTSRILVVDMLQNDIPIDLITGIMVLHAEKVSPLHLVSFITRLYREKNKTGFLKAFTDQPEHITSGLSPLKNVMKELQLRRVSIYPRFHQTIKDTLERRQADVVEIAQKLSDSMSEIHGAIVHCMNMILTDLRRVKDLDLEGLSLPAAYFSSFDHIVRKQLDPVWHKVGPTTKTLVRDLGVLRRLVSYLLAYDPLQFHAYCESLIAANNDPEVTKAGNRSQWMLTDSANTIFQLAKRRCFESVPVKANKQVIDLVDDEDAWDAVYESEGLQRKDKPKPDKRPTWLPSGMQPVLEELPKWSLLAEILMEIEQEILRMENTSTHAAALGNNTTLVMCSSASTCSLLNEFLSSMDDERPKGEWGRKLMLRKLKGYLWWQKRKQLEKEAGLGKRSGVGDFWHGGGIPLDEPGGIDEGDGISEALKKKDREKAEKKASRRRVRGGAPTSGSTRAPSAPPNAVAGPSAVADSDTALAAARIEDDFFTDDLELLNLDDAEMLLNMNGGVGDITTIEFATEFDTHYGLIPPPQQVIIRAYSDDTDDRMLDEIKPRFIVMFEPCMEFVRRVETMLLPILEDRRSADSDAIIKTISTRVGGGRREISKTPSQVIVDMREFRSTLPSLLHASNLLVVPATLTVGDYILTPEICVERKSLSDLVSSFNSGRLYTQCELMSAHYKNPVLLIEFEEDKAFSLDIISEIKNYAKPVGKYPPKKKTNDSDKQDSKAPLIQSKIVLLTLTFPRLRIIWSSSPYATADIFKDLKKDRSEPDPVKAIP